MAERGGASMGQAGEQAGQDQAQDAAEKAAAAEADLDEAQQQLAQQRKKAEADLAAEQLARLKDGLESMRQRQAALGEETRHYGEVRQAQGELTRPQSISVADLAPQQQGLAEESSAQAEKLAGAAAFQLALKGAAGDMSSAASGLEEIDLGAATQQAQARALTRLEQLMAALGDDADQDANQNGGDKEEGQDGQSGGQSAGQQADGVQALSELKLVRLMQEDVNARTLVLEQAAGRPTPFARPTARVRGPQRRAR